MKKVVYPILVTVLAFSTAIFYLLWSQERASRLLAEKNANGLQEVNAIYAGSASRQAANQQKFTAMADTLVKANSKKLTLWAKWAKAVGKPIPAPTPAVAAIHFDTVYIPLPERGPGLAMGALALMQRDTACQQSIARLMAETQAVLQAPRSFAYRDPDGDFYMAGSLTDGNLRLDTLGIPTRLFLREDVLPSPGIGGMFYRQRQIRIEASNPLIIQRPREVFTAREPNKFARVMLHLGTFAAGVGAGYLANEIR